MRAIVITDDNLDEPVFLRPTLNIHGHEVEFLRSRNDLCVQLAAYPEADLLVLLDIPQFDEDRLRALKQVRQIRPDIPVIILSGTASHSHVVAAMKNGASDFLVKPVSQEDLGHAIERLRSTRERRFAENPEPAARAGDEDAFSHGAWYRKVESLLQQAGGTDVPLLFRGETGVGKEVLARKFHARSRRARHPFLKLNCAAFPSELIESELFGHERGAFTGAVKSTAGKFEMANGGTILLDEIGDMDFRLQARLLQVLQDKEFMRVGSAETSRVDVRVMAATHRDLDDAIANGTFREDLFYRLSVIEIHIPPLRERRDEILPLADFLLRKHSTLAAPALEVPGVLRRALLEHDWPGNIRELENVMRKFLVLRSAAPVAEELLARRKQVPATQPRPVRGSTMEAIAQTQPTILAKVNDAGRAAECEAILQVLGATRWNRKEAARLLGIEYKALLYKMKKLGIGESPAVERITSENSKSYSPALGDRFIA